MCIFFAHKKLTLTRWSLRHDAVEAVEEIEMRNDYDLIKTVVKVVILAGKWSTTSSFENMMIQMTIIKFKQFRIKVFFKSKFWPLFLFSHIVSEHFKYPSLSDKNIYGMSQALHFKYPEDIANTILSQKLSCRE